MAIVLTVYLTMSRILRRKKRGPVRAKKKVVDGIEFKSGLEAYMYKALKEAGIQAKYEGVKYEITPSFDFKNKCYECKGRANESFPIRWKLFKKYVSERLRSVTLYKPQNQKECDETVSLILGNKKT